MDTPTITVPEAAQLLGVSRWTLQRAINRGEIAAIRIGQRTTIPRRVIDQLLTEGNTKAAN